MEACVGAHHLSRRLKALGHDARLMPARYVRPYSRGQKNDFRDAINMMTAKALGINIPATPLGARLPIL
jgi:transposase